MNTSKAKRPATRQNPQPAERSVAVDVAEIKYAAQLEEERQKRLQAINLVFGMWKGRTDIPNDGLVFQEELRGEW